MATGAPAHAEVIPDEPSSDTGGSSEELNERGLTAEEQTAFDDMMRGDRDAPPARETAPVGDAPPPGDEDDEDEDDLGAAEPPAPVVKEPSDKDAAPLQADKAQRKTVAYSKHLRELGKRDKTIADNAAALEKERTDRIKLGERLAILNEALTVADPAAKTDDAPVSPLDEEDIDPNEDVWKALDQSNRRIKYIAQSQGAMQQQTAAQRADNDLRSNYIRDAQTFASDPKNNAADYQEAYNYMKDVRLVEIAIGEFDKDPRDPNATFTEGELGRIVQLFNEEEKYLAELALSKGASPAKRIYQMAKVRGYAPKAAAPASPPPPPAPRNGNGARQPAPVVTEVNCLREAAANGKSLSDGGSTSDVTSLTPERLLAMEDDEFDDFIDKLPQRHLQALMGRPSVQ